jgi:predicted RNA-binding protein with RPS1 domain
MYSLYKAVEKALRLTGKWPKSKAEVQKEAEETRMRHHHYHSERNPEGFERLKLENFERWTREEVRAEAQSLKRTPRNHGK